MSNFNKNLPAVSQEHNSGWRAKANYRLQNRKWLGYSGKIALRILSAMEDIPNMNQKKLAELANVSPQQISKIVKGQENMTLKTIAMFSEILGNELISFPSFKYNEFNTMKITFEIKSTMVVIQLTNNNFIPFDDYQNTATINELSVPKYHTGIQYVSI